jgi:hypothetical protein
VPETISEVDDRPIIGGAFSNPDYAYKTVEALRAVGVLEQDIQVVDMRNQKQVGHDYADVLVWRGFAQSQALFYNEAIRSGKILVAVHNVTDTVLITEVFDNHEAEYHPEGPRNLRQDAVAGAAADGVASDPIGNEGSAAPDAMAGGGIRAADEKATERSKLSVHRIYKSTRNKKG